MGPPCLAAGYTNCCNKIYHHECIIQQTKPRQTDYATRQGKADISTACPSCRTALPGSKRRVLCRQPTK